MTWVQQLPLGLVGTGEGCAHPEELDAGTEVPWLCQNPKGWWGALSDAAAAFGTGRH